MNNLPFGKSILKYWTKKEKKETRIVIVTEYVFRGKKKRSQRCVIQPTKLKMADFNRLTKIIALYGKTK